MRASIWSKFDRRSPQEVPKKRVLRTTSHYDIEPRTTPHTCVSMESLRILMSGIAISWRFGLKSDVFQILIKSMILNENMNKNLLLASVYRFWNDFWSILKNIKIYEKYVIFKICYRTKIASVTSRKINEMKQNLNF